MAFEDTKHINKDMEDPLRYGTGFPIPFRTKGQSTDWQHLHSHFRHTIFTSLLIAESTGRGSPIQITKVPW